MHRITASLASMLIAGSLNAQPFAIIPQPREVSQRSGAFLLDKSVKVYTARDAEPWREETGFLMETLGIPGGTKTVRPPSNTKGKGLFIERDSSLRTKGAYRLDVGNERIRITAGDASGVFHATQTLMQLIPPDSKPFGQDGPLRYTIPGVHIEDEPAFPYRGLMIDVARHFLPMDFLKKLVRLMAMQKLNNLHLHLTDDQGWRMEVLKYPRLTAVGGTRSGTLIGRYPGKGSDELPHSGFYTQRELRELVAFAARHHVNIVPEIEMPGHASAAIAAYPSLSCFPDEPTEVIPSMMSKRALETVQRTKGKVVQETWGVFNDVLCPTELTFSFMRDVLDEVMDVFPSPYIHVGGDECPKESWKKSEFCQRLIREKGLKDEHGLQSHFIQVMEEHINRRGRRLIGWDEILEGGLAPDATVMSWRGTSGGIEAARLGHDVIMSPVDRCYLNLYQSEDPSDSIAWGGLTTLRKVYDYDPVPSELDPKQATYIKGVQANLWTEYIKSPALAEFMLFPRLLAIAELGWTSRRKGFEDFTRRVVPWLQRLKANGVNHSSHLFELTLLGSFDPAASGMTVSMTGGPADGKGLYYSIDEGAIKPYKGPFVLKESASVKAMAMMGGSVTDRSNRRFDIGMNSGRPATLTVAPDAPYDKGGKDAWSNGVLGSDARFTDPEWLGWNGKDFTGTVDLGKTATVSTVTLRYFNAPGSWVYPPSSLSVLGSNDGLSFIELAKADIGHATGEGAQSHTIRIDSRRTIRHLRIVARNQGTIPSGKPGAGNPAWLFVDEVSVR